MCYTKDWSVALVNLKKKNSLIRLPWQVMNFICIHVNTNATAALNTFLSTKIYRTAALMNEFCITDKNHGTCKSDFFLVFFFPFSE